ncbi:MAG: hypothetical protein ACUVYA_18580 [Planctomycetota bacterium]
MDGKNASAVVSTVAAAVLGAALGFAVGRALAPRGLSPEEAAERFDRRAEFEAAAARERDAASRLEAAAAEKAALARENSELAGRVAELAARLEQAERRLAEAAKPEARERRAPVAFGKYAELDAIQKADWSEMAGAVESLNALLAEVFQRFQRGEAIDPELQKKVAAENAKLLQYAGAVTGKIATQSPLNGEFTHPITTANLMAAMLERAGAPLSPEQLAAFERFGAAYDADYDSLQERYGEDVPRLQKIVDELELKRAAIGKFEGVLGEEQKRILFRLETRDRLQVDVLSPATSAILIAQHLDLASRESLPGTIASVAKEYELEGVDEVALKEILDAWIQDLEPILAELVGPREPLRLDQIIAAGKAQAKAARALAALPALSEKSRAAILASPGWRVPRLVKAP